jgi:hypothetical protein
MALLAAVLALGCGEDGGVVVTEIDPRAARPFVVSVLDIGQRRYTLGDEISATFSGDPGTVELDYGGRAPFTPIRVEGLTYTFLLETSRTVLRWDNGGSLSLRYAPLFAPDPPIPPLTNVWPKFDAQHVSYDNINTRTPVYFTFDTGAHGRDVIPRLRVDAARITGSTGESWEPETHAGRYGFSLARRPDAPLRASADLSRPCAGDVCRRPGRTADLRLSVPHPGLTAP